MDASVGFLLENLKQLVDYHADLLGGADDELRQLNDELATFQVILENASTEYKRDKLFEDWESKIREAVYDIEDTIDTCVTLATADKAKKRGRIQKLLNSGGKVIGLAEEVKNLRQTRVKPLMDKSNLANFSKADATDIIAAHAREIRQQRSRHIVGFEKEATDFVDVLTGVSEKMEICSIIGMAGLGKTTLAWKVYEESSVKFEFNVRIWVNISDTLNMRNVLFKILSKFETKPSDSLSEEELQERVKGYLEKGKFLIVMDDIWEIDVWKKLKDILPTTNTLGRVLITTRNKDVGYNAATSKELAHDLRFLSNKESWELLQYQVFGNLNDVPQQLRGVGRIIANGCRGLPLSIVVIGGLLEEKTSRAARNITKLEIEWQDVSKSLKSYLVNEDRKKLLGSILSLSYNKLPYQLRNCFLYLGVFPEDAEISVKRLIRLWIAEGFVKETNGQKSLEEVAHDNLEELINRNLVMVRATKTTGQAKICQIHDSVREICKTEGWKLNLFKEVKSESREDITQFRRLCIHSHASDFYSTITQKVKARSVLCFNDTSMTLETKEATSIIENFGLLRVYDAKKVKLPKLPQKFVQQLNHLRYLTLAVADGTFKSLPEIVTDLWNLQTLIVDTPSPTLDVKGDIWKMRQLRHFETRATISFKKIGEGKGGGKLQSLGRLSPDSCTGEVCQKSTGLLTLAIQGDLRNLGESKQLRNLESLNKLKLVHEVRRGGAAEYPWNRLPDSQDFPPYLKTLVLSATHLEWKKMSILSKVDTLMELKLKENAFHGSSWESEGKGFVGLVCFHIDRTNLEYWSASDAHFPKLRFLYINNCEKLLEIPSTLGKSLEVLSLERVTREAVECAKEIEKVQMEKEQKKLNEKVLKLEIAAVDKQRS